jgi:hypothetical protein
MLSSTSRVSHYGQNFYECNPLLFGIRDESSYAFSNEDFIIKGLEGSWTGIIVGKAEIWADWIWSVKKD